MYALLLLLLAVLGAHCFHPGDQIARRKLAVERLDTRSQAATFSDDFTTAHPLHDAKRKDTNRLYLLPPTGDVVDKVKKLLSETRDVGPHTAKLADKLEQGNKSLPPEVADIVRNMAMHTYVRTSLGRRGNSSDVQSLLQKAIKSRRYDLIDPLVELGADPTAMDSAHRHPLLYHAFNNGDARTIAVLMAYGASLKRPQPRVYGPLMSRLVDKSCLIEALLSLGVDPNMQHMDQSILSNAIAYGSAATVQALLRAGADPNWTAPQGTLLSMARRVRDMAKIKLLLDYKADPNVVDRQGQTVLDYELRPRVTRRCNEIIQLLRTYGAKTGRDIFLETIKQPILFSTEM